MKDLHSHLLYGIDDGSKSLEESISLLKKMQEQNITDTGKAYVIKHKLL